MRRPHGKAARRVETAIAVGLGWPDAPVVTRGLPEGGRDAHMAGGTLAQWFDLIVHCQTVTPA